MNDYRPEIDGLRAIAVIAVLMFHTGLVKGGYVGVDVFFVISGYLITRILVSDIAQSRFRIGLFYQRRARRLLPALIVTIILTLIAATILSSPLHVKGIAGSALASLFSLSNFYFYAQSGYFDVNVIQKPLLHTWSLAVEEQFYLIWPPLLALLAIGRRHLQAVAALFMIALASFALNFIYIENKSAIYFLAPFRVFEFMTGAALAYFPSRKLHDSRFQNAITLVGLALIASSAMLFSQHTTFPAWNALVPCVGAALVIQASASASAKMLLSNPLAVGLGLRSYSIYLVHWPIIAFYRAETLQRLNAFESGALILASISAGAALYRYVEVPFRTRDGAPKRIATGPTISLGIISVALAAAFSLFLWRSNGWETRLPASLRDSAAILTREQQDYWNIPTGQRFISEGKRRVLVFGNSFGIDTFHGLAQFSDLETIYSGTTHFGCVAFLLPTTASSPDCRTRNFALLKNNDVGRADVIVLSELWRIMDDPADQHALESLYNAIRSINPDIRIVLVGPRMVFRGRVIDHLVKFRTITGADAAMRRFYDIPLSRLRIFDRKQSSLAAANRVEYVSLVDLLCGEEYCRVVTPGEHRPIYMDDGHFSLKGSQYVGTLLRERYGNSALGPVAADPEKP